SHTFVPPPQHLPSFPTRRSSDLMESVVTQHRAIVSRGWQRRAAIEAILRVNAGDIQYRERTRRRAVDSFGEARQRQEAERIEGIDRKSTRLNSSHLVISYAVFCL